MDFVELFYEEIHGFYPFDTDENKIKTQKTIEYLHEANISDGEILNIVEDIAEQGKTPDALAYDFLPESLWQESLLEKDKFYYHSQLQLTSPPPTWDPFTKQSAMPAFYLEMKIKYTIKDLLMYYYKTFIIQDILQDEKKDTAALNYLIDKYKKLHFIEPIDFVLYLVDYAKDQNTRIKDVFDIAQYDADVIKILQRKVEEAKMKQLNMIVWR